MALIHHLAISNNLPLFKIAHFLAKSAGPSLLSLFPSRMRKFKDCSILEGYFSDYTPAAFEHEFREYFTLQKVAKLDASERILNLMQKEQPL